MAVGARGPPTRRRRQQQSMSTPQLAGLVAIITLCAVYLYFVTHSSLAIQVKSLPSSSAILAHQTASACSVVSGICHDAWMPRHASFCPHCGFVVRMQKGSGFHRAQHPRRLGSVERVQSVPVQPPDAGTFPVGGNEDAKVLLASHGRLLWYNYITGHTQVLHEGNVRTPATRVPLTTGAES